MAFELTYQYQKDLDSRKFNTRAVNWNAETYVWNWDNWISISI